MDKSGLSRNVDALHNLYPQYIDGAATPLPSEALKGLPVWIKGAVRVFALPRLGGLHEPFLYLVQPVPEIAFEHLMRIYRQLIEKLKAPVLVIADSLPHKHRPLLVKFGIGFIYKNESIYAPELGLKFDQLKRFQEKRTVQVENKNEALTPFALKIIAGLLTNQIPPEFTLKGLHGKIQTAGVDISTTKLSLTLKELGANGILFAEGGGPTRNFAKGETKKIWKELLSISMTPFFREAQTNHVPQNRETFCLAGETALAQYSNLASGAIAKIAMSVKEFHEHYEGKNEKIPFGDLYTPNSIQIWKEPPHLFALNGVMNPIELFFSMRNHHDERVQMALEEMLKPYGLSVGKDN